MKGVRAADGERSLSAVAASAEINAPNLNSQTHSLMVPRGIGVAPLPFSLLIYLF